MTNHDSRTDTELLELSAQLLDLQVNSFIDLAIRFPDLWRRLSAPPLRRRLADSLDWPKQFIPELFDQMTLMDFIAIFLNAGPESLEEIWLKHAAAADYLRQTGRLQRVIDSLQIPPKTKAYPNEADFFVNRCRVVGSFEAWRDIDRPGFAAALKQGQLTAVARRVPRRPVGGYPTAGGEVLTTAQLIVARILEAVGVTFLANRTVPIAWKKEGDPTPRRFHCQ